MRKACTYTALFLAVITSICQAYVFGPSNSYKPKIKSIVNNKSVRPISMERHAQPNHSAKKSVKKILAQTAVSFTVITAGLPVISQTLRENFPRSEALLRHFVPKAEASVFKKFNKRTLKEKLANIPIFAIVNRSGNFYLSVKEDGGQQGIFFTSYEDAQQMLFEMLQSPYLQGDARILITPLDKAYELAKHPRETGGVNELGEPELIEFKFHESVFTKEKMKDYGVKDDKNVPVPIFYADGLEIVKDGVKVKPLFFDLKDLFTAWKNAYKNDKNMESVPDIKIYNMPELILLMETSQDHSKIGFFPSSSSIQAVRNVRKTHGTRAKPMYRLAPF